MKRSESYWNSDDEDDGPRTYINVRPARAMHIDYVQSRQAMTELDAEIQNILQRVEKADKKIQSYSLFVSRWPHEVSKWWHDDIQLLKYNKKHDLRKVNQLRTQWSFYANNYHRYDDVGAQSAHAQHAYLTHLDNME